MPYLELNGSKIYYAGDLQEEGTTVLFCHGSGGRHHHWVYQMRGLKGKGINPIAIDLPGHGKSEGNPSNSIASYRDWLNTFTTAAGLQHFVIGGHSMGGAISLSYALQFPEEIKAVILVGSGGRLRVLPAFLDTLKEGTVPPSLADFLYGPQAADSLVKNGHKEIADTDASIYYADLSACDAFDVMSELPRIEVPVLIICGAEDRLTPVKYSTYMKDALPRAELVIIEGAGHMVMLEKPEEVNRAIISFINNT